MEKPEKYPRTQHPTSPNPPMFREVSNINYLIPVEQNFSWLKQGCKFCFHNVYHSYWNSGTSDEYMRCLGLPQSFNRKFVIEKAKELFEKNPNHPNPSSTMMFPPLWNSDIDLYQYIDLPMHLLFLGITKSIIDWTFEWLKLHKSLTPFGTQVESVCLAIKQLQCDFCKLESFSNGQDVNTSGWRAENHLAFARVITYTFGFIRDLISSKDDYEHEILAFESLHYTCLCMISRLMTLEKVSTDEVGDYIKLFLTVLDLCERITFTESSSGMFWFQRSNFLCLLNLPQQIERFGSIRKYWEGSRERFIQEIKPLMKHTRETTSFLKIQLDKLNKGQLTRQLCKEVQTNVGNISYNRFKKFLVYDNIETVQQIIMNGEVLSLLRELPCSSDKVFVLIRDTNGARLHEIIFNDREGKIIYSMFYSPISVKTQRYLTFANVREIDMEVFCPSLGVPRMLENARQVKCFAYSAFSSDWLYREKGGKFLLPSVNSSVEFFINQYI